MVPQGSDMTLTTRIVAALDECMAGSTSQRSIGARCALRFVDCNARSSRNVGSMLNEPKSKSGLCPRSLSTVFLLGFLLG